MAPFPRLDRLAHRLSRAAALAALLCSLAGVAVAQEVGVSVINGTPTDGYQSVGAVAYGADLANLGFCSGTLIEPNKVLTAAHCTQGEIPANLYFVLGGVPYPVASIYVHQEYDPETLENDVSVLMLENPVVGITPSPIYRQAPLPGQQLVLVGLGLGGTPRDGIAGGDWQFGTKRVGFVRIDQVTSHWIIWRFDSMRESNTAPGDSGGPAFLSVNGVLHVAGITSWGVRPLADLGDVSYDTRVDRHQDYIDRAWLDNRRWLVYRHTERGFALAGGTLVPYSDRGYLLVDSTTGDARTVALRRTAGEPPAVVAGAWSSDGLATVSFGYRGSQGDPLEAIAALGPAEWRGVCGRAAIRVADRARLAFGTGERLTFGDGILRRGRLTARIDDPRSMAAAQAPDLDSLAAAYDAEFDSALPRSADTAAPAAPSPDPAEDDTIYVHRVSGLARQEGGGTLRWYRARGFLVHRPDTGRTVLVTVFADAQGSFPLNLDFQARFDHDLDRAYPLNGDEYRVLHGTRKLYQWGALYGRVERATLSGLAGPGELPRRLAGLWEDLSVSAGEGTIEATRLRTRLDAARTAAAEGQSVEDVVDSLQSLLAARQGASFSF